MASEAATGNKSSTADVCSRYQREFHEAGSEIETNSGGFSATTPRLHRTEDFRFSAKNSPGGGGLITTRGAATSVLINADMIRRGNMRRILDFSQVSAKQNRELNLNEARVDNELPLAPPTTFTPLTDKLGDQVDTATSPAYRRDPTMKTPTTETSLTSGREGSSNRVMIRKKSSADNKMKKKPRRSVLPSLGMSGRRQASNTVASRDPTEPRTGREDCDANQSRGIEIQGKAGVLIDDVLIRRKDQARILEQTLQLLFAAEVLLFVEYMEVFMPLLYSACIGGLWHLPNAKYNILLMNMSYSAMVTEMLTSLGYAMLEVVSFLSVYYFIKKKYGISALYQLAFLLESYTMTLQGKLIGCFITILNSSTMHQGIDITFKFDWDALLKSPNPFEDDS